MIASDSAATSKKSAAAVDPVLDGVVHRRGVGGRAPSTRRPWPRAATRRARRGRCSRRGPPRAAARRICWCGGAAQEVDAARSSLSPTPSRKDSRQVPPSGACRHRPARPRRRRSPPGRRARPAARGRARRKMWMPRIGSMCRLTWVITGVPGVDHPAVGSAKGSGRAGPDRRRCRRPRGSAAPRAGSLGQGRGLEGRRADDGVGLGIGQRHGRVLGVADQDLLVGRAG